MVQEILVGEKRNGEGKGASERPQRVGTLQVRSKDPSKGDEGGKGREKGQESHFHLLPLPSRHHHRIPSRPSPQQHFLIFFKIFKNF